jgi:hypothetical protein
MRFNRVMLSAPLFVLLGLIPACRFGNYSEPPKSVKTFKKVELFRTRPSKFETIAIYNDDNYGYNEEVPLSAIPVSILDNFTNPVFLAEPVATPGIQLFIGLGQSSCMADPENSSCIGTIVEPDDSITVSTESPYSQFGGNPACTMNLEMQQIGNLDRGQPGTITYSDGSTGTVAGTLNLEFRLIRNFKGDCSGILKILADCYASGSGCSTDELYWANQLFDLYVRQSGALKLEFAHKIKTLAYIVHFDYTAEP